MKREVVVSVFAVLIVAAAILSVYYLNLGLTGFAVFSQNNQAAFNEGTYANVVYDANQSAVVLAANQTTGTYTSKIFDGGSGATWNNLTWQGQGVDFEVRSCAASDCANTSFATANLGNLSLTGQYFQYKATLDSLNDTLAGVSVDYTATITIPLSVSLTEPSGEKTSLSAIPLTFTITGGTGTNLTCLYNIVYAGGVLVPNTTIVCAGGANTKTFDIAAKGGDNILTLYVSDSSGNVSVSSGFSVSIPSEGTITGGAVQGEEETTPAEAPLVPPPAPSVTQISLGEVPGQDIIQGNSRALSISVQNTGTVPVSACVLHGDDSGLVTITDGTKDFAPGASGSFAFSVDVSEAANAGAYTLSLSVDCAETSSSRQVTVNVMQKKLDFNITDVLRTRQNRVRVDYTLTELAGLDQNLQIFFSIKDSSGTEVANATQNRSIDANETDDFRTNIPINETLEGNLTLSAAFNSEVYSSTVLEPISLGAPIGGFAIFGGEGGAGGIAIVVIVLAVIVVAFFLARKLRTRE